MKPKAAYQEPFRLDPALLDLKEEPPVGAGDRALAAAAATAPVPEAAKPRRRRFGPWLAGGLATLLAGALGLEAYTFVADLWQQNVVLGGLFAAVALGTAGAALGLLGREASDLRRLNRVASLRSAAERLIASEVHGDLHTVIPPIEKLYRDRPELRDALQTFEAQDSDALSDGERLRLFARIVLKPVDRQAYALVLRGARDVGVLTAVSPLGVLDGFVVLGRNLMTLRAVARLYGVRPGLVGTFGLLKRVLRNVAIAGLGELVTEHAAHGLGAGLLGMLSAKAGQGVTNGVLAARLGLVAMTQCRPVPFEAEEMPRLATVRNELLKAMEPEVKAGG